MKEVEKMNWEAQKICTDVGDYELVVEKQRRNWECEQSLESWKWIVIYHGAVVASGSENNVEDAKKLAENNVPDNVNADDDDCGCNS